MRVGAANATKCNILQPLGPQKRVSILTFMCENIFGPYYYNSPFKLRLAPSQVPNAGLGVFACEDIPAGSRIDEYTGEVLSSNPISNYALEVRDDCFIDARDFPRCYMAMINDCSYIARRVIRRKKRWVNITPDAYYGTDGRQLIINCEFVVDKPVGRGFIHSLVDIPAGAELFVEYGPAYWKCL